MPIRIWIKFFSKLWPRNKSFFPGFACWRSINVPISHFRLQLHMQVINYINTFPKLPRNTKSTAESCTYGITTDTGQLQVHLCSSWCLFLQSVQGWSEGAISAPGWVTRTHSFWVTACQTNEGKKSNFVHFLPLKQYSGTFWPCAVSFLSTGQIIQTTSINLFPAYQQLDGLSDGKRCWRRIVLVLGTV